MEKIETDIYNKDLEQMINLYRSVKCVFEDIVDSLKILIMVAAIGLLAYIVSILTDILIAVKLFDGIFIFLVVILLFFVGALAIILKLKDL